MVGDLLPVLPDEIARECLIRVHYDRFATVRSVCRLWREEVDSPPFHRLRLSQGLARLLVALAQAEPGPESRTGKNQTSPAPVYRPALFEPATGTWRPLPPVPGLPNGLPLFCGLAAVGRKLVVVGGWDPDTWAASDAVHVYDFASASWRAGARVPGPRRSFFACAGSEADGLVFVAGGHDEEKNALRSALAYDVAGDRWVPLPDMERERDECKGVFLRRGGFHVIGGYPTEAQGRFVGSAEAFDAAAWEWGPVVEDVLEGGTCPRTCTAGPSGELYVVGSSGKVMRADVGGGGRRTVAEVPEDARVAPQVAAWGRSVMVVGSGCHGGPQAAYVMDLTAEGKAAPWRKTAVPLEYSGHVQAACCLEI